MGTDPVPQENGVFFCLTKMVRSEKGPFTPFDVGSLIRALDRLRYLRANCAIL